MRLHTSAAPLGEPSQARLVRVVALLVAAFLVALGPLSACRSDGSSLEPAPLRNGVYTNPGARGVVGAADFASFSGTKVHRVLDFLPTTSWLEMTRNAWLLTPYTGKGYQLELSVPMLPDTAGVSLAACAAGSYDSYWRSIADSVVAAGLPTTAIRPGWEMNGNWYRWSAAGRAGDYIGCYRSLVTAMRAAAGQQFVFVFNPNVGPNSMAAELAYPGDTFVDEISVDVYDTSWSSYPTPAGVTQAAAQTSAWNWIKRGDHGLDFWSAFARTHAKPLGVSEWGLTWRSDGRGGGDNPAFVDRMFDFAADPVNNVTSMNYFNNQDSAKLKHDIMRPDTVFPLSAARFKARSAALAKGTVTPAS